MYTGPASRARRPPAPLWRVSNRAVLWPSMKTTIDRPDAILERTKIAAARRRTYHQEPCPRRSGNRSSRRGVYRSPGRCPCPPSLPGTPRRVRDIRRMVNFGPLSDPVVPDRNTGLEDTADSDLLRRMRRLISVGCPDMRRNLTLTSRGETMLRPVWRNSLSTAWNQ